MFQVARNCRLTQVGKTFWPRSYGLALAPGQPDNGDSDGQPDDRDDCAGGDEPDDCDGDDGDEELGDGRGDA